MLTLGKHISTYVPVRCNGLIVTPGINAMCHVIFFLNFQKSVTQNTIAIKILWSSSCIARYFHDDVIKGKHFPRYWTFVRGIHRSPVNSPHKRQWRGALMFSLICVWINGWVNNHNHKAVDLRRYRAHYDVIVMLLSPWSSMSQSVSFDLLLSSLFPAHFCFIFAYFTCNPSHNVLL